jgi:cysteine-rich repeat protein
VQRAKRQDDSPASSPSLKGAALVSTMTSRWTPGALLLALLAMFVVGCGTGVPLVGNDDAGVVISFDKPVSDIEPSDIADDWTNDFVPGELPEIVPVDAMTGCEDNDLDGFGRGTTCRGVDCNDRDPRITNQCYEGCFYPDVREGCSCEPGAQPLPCDLNTGRSSGPEGVCNLGQRTCAPNRAGAGWSWGACERWRENFRYIGPISACPGSCLPTCRHQIICPTPSDPMSAAAPAGSTGVAIGASAPAVFCPSGTASGGITSSCAPVMGTAYTRGTTPSSVPWVDACAAPGHLTYLPGTDDGYVPSTLPFAFQFYGSAQTVTGISSNGILSFPDVSTLPTYTNTTLPYAPIPNAIFPFWDDLMTRSTGICVTTSGTAPSRQYVVEWADTHFCCTDDPAIHNEFEVLLSEGTQIIDVRYNRMVDPAGRSSGSSATIGIQQGTGARYDLVSFDTTAAVASGDSIRWLPTASSTLCARGVYNRVFDGDCAPSSPAEAVTFRGTIPFWGQFNFTSNVPSGTSIQFEVRASDTLAGLSTAVAVRLSDAPFGITGAPVSIDLRAALRAASTPGNELWNRRYLQLTAYLNPSADGGTAPTLTSTETQYTCLPREETTPCRAGGSCAYSAVPCHRGVIVCVTPPGGGLPRESCTDAGPVPAGTTCGTGMVCNPSGACVPCSEGGTCSPATADPGCATGRVSCATGLPVCNATLYPAGTPCGSMGSTDYIRTSSAAPWRDVCALPGHTTHLVTTDDGAALEPLPFPFRYYSNTVSSVGISSNGMMQFGGFAGISAYTNGPLPNASTPDTLFAFWDDLMTRGVGICTATLGIAPNRTFVTQWSDLHYCCTDDPAVHLNFEVALNEGTNTIDVLYGTMTGDLTRASGDSATVGIQEGTGSRYQQIAYNTAGSIMSNSSYRWTPSGGMVCNTMGRCVSCTDRTPCSPTGNPCDTGVTVCTSGVPTCAATGRLTPGTSCGTDQVCSPAGACIACREGASCSTGVACEIGAVTCVTGVPTCRRIGYEPRNTTCVVAGGPGRCDGMTTCIPCGSVEVCDGVDNNCNGSIDEALTRACYTGPVGTSGVGLCRPGSQTCASAMWTACSGEVLPATERCNGNDDNCDGVVDEPFRGGCGNGVIESGEQCDDGNMINTDACTNLCTRTGVVLGGNAQTYLQQAFSALGEPYTTRTGQFLPTSAGGVLIMSNDGGTDATVDYNAFLAAGGHVLMIGGSNYQPYYDWIRGYLSHTGNVGAPGWQTISCTPHYASATTHPITQYLASTFSFGVSSSSYHMVRFSPTQPTGTTILGNTCLSGDRGSVAVRRYSSGGTFTYLAYDCGNYGDGTTVSQFVAPFIRGYLGYIRSGGGMGMGGGLGAMGLGRTCTAGMGACARTGAYVCTADGSGTECSATMGTPSTEICDGIDNDCDGMTDEGLTRSCYGGPPGTAGVGVCTAGVESCAAGAWTACAGEVRPSTEVCDNVDNNCNGSVDEALTRACYTGPSGTSGVGVCRPGTQTCSAGSWGSTCSGQVVPRTELCDGLDDNCNGTVDDPFRGGCGNGVVEAGEQCDDGNMINTDACTNACTRTGVVLGGNAQTYLQQAFSALGEPYTTRTGQFLPTSAGGVLIMSNDGGTDATVDYNAFLAAGGHVLMIGGSNYQPYYDWVRGYLSHTGNVGAPGWQTISCTPHYATTGPHAITQYLPSSYSFGISSSSYHMVRFSPTQPTGTTILGNTCLSGDRGAIAVRQYTGGGTFTYLAYDCGNYGDGTSVSQFVAPFIRGYLAFVRSGMGGMGGGLGAMGLGQTCTAGMGACARTGTYVCNSAQNGTTCSVTAGSPSAEICDGIDNDCDGMIDEGLTRSCYGGPSGTAGVGACRAGTETCAAGSWGSCAGEVRPSTEVCDNVDNDCDGATDETLTRSCYTGASGTSGVGICRPGTQTCSAGSWGSTCPGQVVPRTELCDGLDDNCNGTVDDPFRGGCGNGVIDSGEQCDDGNMINTDACTNACTRTGVVLGGNAQTYLQQAFSALGEPYTTRTGQFLPASAGGVLIMSNDGGTDATVDYNAFLAAGGHVLMIGGSNYQPYYDWVRGYLSHTGNVGAPGWQTISCTPHYATTGPHAITQYLPSSYSFGVSSASYHMVRFSPTQPTGTTILGNTCLSGDRGSVATRRYSSGGTFTYLAYDCGNYGDGASVSQFVAPFIRGYLAYVRTGMGGMGGGGGAMGLGLTCTTSMGACARTGVYVCTADGSGTECNAPPGVPSAEVCNNVDDDCDGMTDEGLTQSCYGGPSGTAGVGACRAGTSTCAAGAYGACVGEVRPSIEVCDNVDNDCDGLVDEGLTRACYTGPSGTSGVGTCRPGTQTCSAGSWGSTCPGEVVPATERCNSIDDNCNGTVDEPFIGGIPASASPRVLVYSPAAGSITSLLPSGSVVTSVSDAGWRAMTRTQFESYNMLVIGPGCSYSGCQGLYDTRNTWGPAVTGRIIVETSHAIEHGQNAGPTAWLRWIAGGNGTGLYAVDDDSQRPLDYMTPFGGITSVSDGYSPGVIVMTGHPAMVGVSNADITMGSNHASMTAWPSTFTVLARPNSSSSPNAMVLARAGGASGMGLGATCTAGVGACARTGTYVCTADGSGTECTVTAGAPSAEICDGVDNDCDGTVDDGLTRTCYTGPSGTAGVGACTAGTETCAAGAWGSCVGQVVPATEVCDNVDNNCNGATDESLTRSCYTGPSGTSGVGTCRPGTQTCSAGSWGSTCPGEVVPRTELCDSLDDNCNGTADDPFLSNTFRVDSLTASGCAVIDHNGVTSDDRGGIAASTTNVFYSGDAQTGRFPLNLSSQAGLGRVYDAMTSNLRTGRVYTFGTSATVAMGSGGTATHLIEIDGTTGALTTTAIALSTPLSLPSGTGIFAGWDRVVVHNTSRVYSIALPSGAVTDVGAVAAPAHTVCESWAYWGVAEYFSGQLYVTFVRNSTSVARMAVPSGVITVVATFSNLSDMCSFTVSPTTSRWYFHHEGGSQFGGSAETLGYCGATFTTGGGGLGSGLGDSCTAGMGFCARTGTVVCNSAQNGTTCNATAGIPSAEVCNNIDDDCDGMTDEGLTQSCYGGPSGTAGVGACTAGTSTCSAGAYGACVGEVRPSTEVCDNVDNNCNGATDESLTRGCYTGATGTSGVGTCRPGTQTCMAGSWGSTCPGEVVPRAERCDSLDDNCNGTVDEDFIGGVPASSTPRVLVYSPAEGSTAPAYPAGSVITRVSDAGWRAMTTVQFATYNMIVIGSGCTYTSCQAIYDTRNTWGPAVTGRVIVETSHALEHGLYNGPRAWMRWIVGSFGTGLFVSDDESTRGLDYMTPFGTMTSVTDGYTPGVIVMGSHPAMAGVVNGDITMGSNHSSLTAWPSSFVVLARPTSSSSPRAMVIARDAGGSGMGVGAVCTAGIGACLRTGMYRCTADGSGTECTVTAGSPLPEVCDGVDNDCDGMVDEGLTRSCYTGPSGTAGVGACVAGTQACVSGSYGACVGQVVPATETCDGVDNDCDGMADETLTRSCYTGPSGTSGVGTCRPGTQTCTAGSWGSTCPGQTVPRAERCDSADDDCNGTVDNGFTVGVTCTVGMGFCSRTGVFVCDFAQTGITCTATPGMPSAELCNNIDDDCDGMTDEGLTQSCYGGPSGTAGVGACRAGTQTCTAGAYGACAGEVRPSTEVCDNVDNNCNGATDESLTRSCYTGPSGTSGVGTCRPGTQTCSAGSWGSTCPGEVVPRTELCDSLDDNCNGDGRRPVPQQHVPRRLADGERLRGDRPQRGDERRPRRHRGLDDERLLLGRLADGALPAEPLVPGGPRPGLRRDDVEPPHGPRVHLRHERDGGDGERRDGDAPDRDRRDDGGADHDGDRAVDAAVAAERDGHLRGLGPRGRAQHVARVLDRAPLGRGDGRGRGGGAGAHRLRELGVLGRRGVFQRPALRHVRAQLDLRRAHGGAERRDHGGGDLQRTSSDMCTFTVSPTTGRWYFHHEGGVAVRRQSAETLGLLHRDLHDGRPAASAVGPRRLSAPPASARAAGTGTNVCNTAQTGTVCSGHRGHRRSTGGLRRRRRRLRRHGRQRAVVGLLARPLLDGADRLPRGDHPGHPGRAERGAAVSAGVLPHERHGVPRGGGWLRCAGDLQRRQRRVPRRRLRRQRHGVPRGGGHLRRAGDLHGLQRGVSERHAPPDGDPVPRECGRVRRGGELQRHRRDLPGGRAAALGHDVQPAHRRRVQRLRVRVPVGADAVRHHLHHRHLDLHRGRGRLRAHRQLALHDQRLEHRRAEREPGLPARLRADARRPGALLGLQRLRSARQRHGDQQRRAGDRVGHHHGPRHHQRRTTSPARGSVRHRVQCWGYNAYGQLGDGSTTNRTVAGDGVGPHQRVARERGQHRLRVARGRHHLVLGLQRLRSARRRHDHQPNDAGACRERAELRGIVAAGGNHTCGLRRDGTVWSAGATTTTVSSATAPPRSARAPCSSRPSRTRWSSPPAPTTPASAARRGRSCAGATTPTAASATAPPPSAPSR